MQVMHKCFNHIIITSLVKIYSHEKQFLKVTSGVSIYMYHTVRLNHVLTLIHPSQTCSGATCQYVFPKKCRGPARRCVLYHRFTQVNPNLSFFSHTAPLCLQCYYTQFLPVDAGSHLHLAVWTDGCEQQHPGFLLHIRRPLPSAGMNRVFSL